MPPNGTSSGKLSISDLHDSRLSTTSLSASTTVWFRADSSAASSCATPPSSAASTHTPGDSVTCAGPCATITPLSSIS